LCDTRFITLPVINTTMTFTQYTNAIHSALIFNPKINEVVARKQEILDGVYRMENLEPTTVLFLGFNPAILSCTAKTLAVTEISDAAQAYHLSV